MKCLVKAQYTVMKSNTMSLSQGMYFKIYFKILTTKFYALCGVILFSDALNGLLCTITIETM